jgi:transposase
MSTVNVGIDVSKSSFDTAVLNASGSILSQSKEATDSAGFKNLLKILSSYPISEVRVAMESTGIYHLTLLCFLVDHGYKCYVINPVLINNFVKSQTTRRTKTDAIDCRYIAKFLIANEANLTDFKNDVMTTLKPLNRIRETTAMDIAKTKTDIKRVLSILFPELESAVNVFTKSVLMLLRRHPGAAKLRKLKINTIANDLNRFSAHKSGVDARMLLELAQKSVGTESASYEKILVIQIDYLIYLNDRNDELETMLSDVLDEQTNNDIELLKSIKGIGLITARSLMIELGSISNFNSAKQMAAFIGIDPATKQSGSSVNVKGRISKRGCSFLRRTMWQIAAAVIRYEGKFRDYFLKKKAEGKKYKQSVIAVANKLLRTLYAMLSNSERYAIK